MFLVLVRYTLVLFGKGERGKGEKAIPHGFENCYIAYIYLKNNVATFNHFFDWLALLNRQSPQRKCKRPREEVSGYEQVL